MQNARIKMRNDNVKLKFPYLLLVIFVFLFLFFNLSGANAAGFVPCGGEGEADCTTCDFFVMAKNIIDFIVVDFVPPVAVLFVVIGGILYYTSAGNEGRITLARNILTGVVIGIIIIYGAWLIVDTVLMTLADKTGGQLEGFPWPWNEISC